MPYTSNTVTVEVDPQTTIELSGIPRAGRTMMTIHKSDYVKGQAIVTSTTLTFRLNDEVKRSLVDALEMMR